MSLDFFFILQAIIVVLLILVILAQQSSSGLGGLAGGNNQQQFFAGRPEANLLTRLTTILVSLFFLSSMMFAFTTNSFDALLAADRPVVTNDAETILIEE
ncbi:MAG: preprotein translocase subunit SecG [Alphaproteobacteria bacterium]